MFSPTYKTRFINEMSLLVVGLSFVFFLVFVFVVLMLFACGDIELNLCPKKWSSCCNFSVSHWSLNSISGHIFSKIALLQAYHIIHQYGMICLGKSYPDASVSSDNGNLNLSGYKLVRANDPVKVKGGSLFVYFKESLPVRCFPNSYLIFLIKNWRKPTLYLFIKEVNNWSKIIDQYHYCLFVVKYLKKFSSLFKYLDDSNLLNGNQFGFCLGDSCEHQLLLITHKIYKGFDANPSLEVWGVFVSYWRTLLNFGRQFIT